jgi:RND family efflux transporter MFP subunit
MTALRPLLLCGLTLGLTALVACAPGGGAPEAPAAAATTVGTGARIEIATIQPVAAEIELTLPGEIEGSRDATLASAMGGPIERVAVRDGQSVSRGQVLVEVDSAAAAAAVDMVTAQLALARSDLERVRSLGDLGTAQQIQQAETQVAVLDAQLRQARAQLSHAVLRAPFAGIVGQIDVEAGEFAAPGQPLVRVVQLDPVKVTLSVPDRDVVALEPGLAVGVTASAVAAEHEGRISHVGPAADPRTRAFPVEVEVPNPDGLLKPGMIATVKAGRRFDEAGVVIPLDWVVTHLDGQGVFVESEGLAHWRPITLGAIVRDQVVVTGGVAVGDRVVITGHRELAEGDAVLVVREGVCCTGGRAVWGTEG